VELTESHVEVQMQPALIKKTLAATAVCAMATMGLGPTGAFAGEITGNGRSLKNPDGSLNGKSVCAFSGQNDAYSGNPNIPDEDGFFRTQSWGQVPKAVRDTFPPEMHPGIACNPTGGAEPES
jgi:hypothetical protein